jgi:hypothetical protein
MKTSHRKRHYISSVQLNRVNMIIVEQWDDVMLAAQKRAAAHHQQRLFVLRQATRQHLQQQDIA